MFDGKKKKSMNKNRFPVQIVRYPIRLINDFVPIDFYPTRNRLAYDLFTKERKRRRTESFR